MKIHRLLFFLLTAFALLFVSSQVFASPVDVQAENSVVGTETPKVKGPERATQNAEDNASKQPEKGPKGKHENYKGTVSAFDGASITLTLKDGSSVTINVTTDTQIKFAGKKDTTSTIEVGMTVIVQALRADDGTLTARSVMVIPGQPVKIHRVGTVTEYNVGAAITIQNKDGNTFTFPLAAETKILPAERAGELTIGSRVTIIAPRDPATGGVNITGIVIHPAKP